MCKGGSTDDSAEAKAASKTLSNATQIDRLCGKETSYDDFYQNYLLLNRPCILSCGLVKQWNASKRLKAETGIETEHGSSGAFGKLAELYGDDVAPVAISCPAKQGGDEEEYRREMTISEAVKLMQSQTEKKVYIKDWHIARKKSTGTSDKGKENEQRSSSPLYETPHLFADDWMNNRPSEEEDDDFRFCYAGTAGTQTKLHRDVYTSYSWSTNVVGRKRWRLFPPAVKRHLRRFPNISSSEMAPSVDEMQALQQTDQLGHVKEGKTGWPEWELAFKACIEIEQEEGETIFVPSDWYHEVLNLTDCISLNHNWCNACNIVSMYRSMCEEVERTEDALEDVKTMIRERSNATNEQWRVEWTSTVQQVLTTNVGWGWQGLWKMVEYNLKHPPCASHSRPSLEYVTEQLRPCIDDFEARQDFQFLGKETQSACRASRLSLEQIEDSSDG